MLVIDFAQRRKAAQVVIPDIEAKAMAPKPQEPKLTTTGNKVRMRLPWETSVRQVSEGNQKDVSRAMTCSDANFDVYLDPLQTHDGIKVEHKAVRRSDDHSLLGVVGKNYTPLQNSRAFQWFQPILEHSDAVLTHAGSVYEGRKTTIIAKLPGSTMDVGHGDIVESYLKLTNSHDGKGSLKLEFLPLRLVCLNGLASLQDGSMLLKTRHTQQIGMRLDNVQDIIRRISDDYREVAKVFEALAKKPVQSEAEFRTYVQSVLLCKPDSPMIDQCVINFQAGRGAKLAGSTWWGAYNAVQEYLQWQAHEDQRKGIDSLLYGRNDLKNRRALALAIAA